jgi:hypothetical protein
MPSDVAAAVEGASLTYTFANVRPIELIDLTASLLALGEQFQRLMQELGEGAGDDYRLYVARHVPVASSSIS